MDLSFEELTITEFECEILSSNKRKPIGVKKQIIQSSNPIGSDWFTKITRPDSYFTMIESTIMPRRYHRKKRIQKKWIKRYGYKRIYRKEFEFKKVEIASARIDELDALQYSAQLIRTKEINHGKRSVYVPPLC